MSDIQLLCGRWVESGGWLSKCWWKVEVNDSADYDAGGVVSRASKRAGSAFAGNKARELHLVVHDSVDVLEACVELVQEGDSKPRPACVVGARGIGDLKGGGRMDDEVTHSGRVKRARTALHGSQANTPWSIAAARFRTSGAWDGVRGMASASTLSTNCWASSRRSGAVIECRSQLDLSSPKCRGAGIWLLEDHAHVVQAGNE